jgi:hypothetical protein
VGSQCSRLTLTAIKLLFELKRIETISCHALECLLYRSCATIFLVKRMKTFQTVTRNKALLLIWLIFICKGLFFSSLFPIWEGFDEFAHFAFIQYLDTYKSLPLPDSRVSIEVQQSLEAVPLPWMLKSWPLPHVTHDAYWQLQAEDRAKRERVLRSIPVSGISGEGNSLLYESKQGPLYYILMTPLYGIIRDFALPSRVFFLRLMNILIGSAIIPLAYMTGREVFADHRLAVGVCVVIAAMPGIYIDSSRVGNDNLAIVEYGLLTWCCLIAIRVNARYFLLVGSILGLLLVTKAYGFAAIPAVSVVGIEIVRKNPSRRVQNLFLITASFCLTAGISGWWFLRNLRIKGTILWADGVLTEKLSYLEIIGRIEKINWTQLFRSLMDSHIWIGSWSFLGLRSWMYQVFDWWALVVTVGVAMLVVRGWRSRNAVKMSISLQPILILGLLWGGFLLSTVYHGVMNYLNEGVGASAGWYLYAVIVPEGLLIVAGLSAFRFSRNLMLGLMACSILLEVYATHWILIPYYAGLIRHNGSGGLQAFHPGSIGIGMSEVLTRLTINRPPFLTATTFFGTWVVYLSASISLFFLALRNFRHPLIQD